MRRPHLAMVRPLAWRAASNLLRYFQGRPERMPGVADSGEDCLQPTATEGSTARSGDEQDA